MLETMQPVSPARVRDHFNSWRSIAMTRSGNSWGTGPHTESETTAALQDSAEPCASATGPPPAEHHVRGL